jgi:hypothetical protein
MTSAENPRQQRAFLLYQSLGPRRTYTSVAQQLGVSERTVRSWASQGKWRQRLVEREAQAARQAADQVIGSSVANAARKRRMVELALMKVIKAINADKVRIQVGDLDRLLRLQAFLDGDGVILTADALRQRPPQEVLDALNGWLKLLTDDELHALVDRSKQTVDRPAAPLPPTDRSPLGVAGEEDNEQVPTEGGHPQ